MTTTQEFVPTKVLLVGSVALDTVQEVFHVAGKLLGRRLARVPDGEPGGRRAWISWQYPLLRSNVFLTVSSDVSPVAGRFPQLCIAEGVAESDLRFGELGYAREARASYLDFVAARKAGDIPAAARFQVCLPTPLAVISAFCRGKDMVRKSASRARANMSRSSASLRNAGLHVNASPSSSARCSKSTQPHRKNHASVAVQKSASFSRRDRNADF
jgi:hypothetical protein